MENLNKYIDHTILKADATQNDIDKLCEEALKYDFKAVCVNPHWVRHCIGFLEGSQTLVCTVVGFPLGATLSSAKAFETRMCVDGGASEIDMVINIGAVKKGDWNLVRDDIEAVVEAASGRTVKVIIESCLLTDEEIVASCKAAMEAKAQFVKTSTGFSNSGASLNAVRLMKETVGDQLEVKASGGIRDKKSALEMIEAGASRIGTSSGIAIVS